MQTDVDDEHEPDPPERAERQPRPDLRPAPPHPDGCDRRRYRDEHEQQNERRRHAPPRADELPRAGVEARRVAAQGMTPVTGRIRQIHTGERSQRNRDAQRHERPERAVPPRPAHSGAATYTPAPSGGKRPVAVSPRVWSGGARPSGLSVRPWSSGSRIATASVRLVGLTATT